ncbi:unnamed protein product [Mytilus coruscus]|uniref:Reverse transcriptase domain-containing protein n=1 Tax=Mytilus coruscus TaxID=42192 RepID=A0A6J8ENS3_MYTCO|nr:unnamed protein product [Mytilus coruscus]
MCNRLVERFNGTMKLMLKRLCAERPWDWDKYLGPALFAYREVPQESVLFSPFELVYGWPVRGPMTILKELWTREITDPDVRFTYEKSRSGKMKVGQKVLVLLPTKANKLLMHWKGPFSIVEKMSDLDYRIDMKGKIKMFQVNMLKLYVECEPTKMCISSPEHKVSFIATVSVIDLENGDTDGVDSYESELIEKPAAVANETLRDVHINEALKASEIVKVLPFRLVNSGATFVRCMRKVLEGLENVDNFDDDIIVYTLSFNHHLEVLGSAFESLASANLSARPSKYYIVYSSFEVLGHIVGTNRLSPNPDKIEVIKNAHRPTTKKQVRSFIGMAEFYRKFVPNFSDIASPLTDLTKKDNQIRYVRKIFMKKHFQV